MDRVLILGATSDIARALAVKFANEGYDLHLAARETGRLSDLKMEIMKKNNVDVNSLIFDAVSYADHSSFYSSLNPKPDIAICVFGYLGNQTTAQNEFSETKKIIETNLTGAISILNIIANDFEQRKTGTIIGVSSVAGDRIRRSNYIYGCAKAGFTAYLSGLRSRLFRSAVHVMTVKPGFVKTKMTKNLDLPKLITSNPERVAKDIFKAFQKRNDILYTIKIWKYIMTVVKIIPERLFRKW